VAEVGIVNRKVPVGGNFRQRIKNISPTVRIGVKPNVENLPVRAVNGGVAMVEKEEFALFF
jgi:hypothetical protein